MMDLEPLREAARRMRERAIAATPGPWTVTDNLCIEAPSGFRGRVVPSVGAYEDGWPSAADAQHIASWPPGVALSIAAWLDNVAVRAPWACRETPELSHATVIARAYLGGDRD